MELSNLKSGVQYVFQTKVFETPLGEVIPGESKLRKFICKKDIGAVGMEKHPFLEVERENGTRHLIAVETIQAIELA